MSSEEKEYGGTQLTGYTTLSSETTNGSNAPSGQASRAFDEIRRRIIDCEFPPGDVLSESALCRMLGMSRTPVRAALNRLGNDGLIELRPNRSAIVTPVTIPNVIELFRMRAFLETFAVQRCAVASDRSEFERFRDEIEAQGKALEDRLDDPELHDAHFKLSNEFDQAVCARTRNRYFASAMEDIWNHSRRLRRMADQNPQRLYEANREHLALCEAICAGDAEAAASAVHNHLQKSLENAIGSIAGTDVAISVDLFAS